jgi:hypothetical protein
MKNSHALILALVALVVGVFAGAGITWQFWTARSAEADLVRTEVSLMRNVLVLKELQTGRSAQGREKLEQQLDSDVLLLDVLKREHKFLERETFTSLPSVFEYRAAFPYASQDERVTRILKSVGERRLTTACTRTGDQKPSSDCPSPAGEAGR